MHTPNPTTRELQLLEVLWRRKEASVRQIHEDLRDELPIVQTTVQAFLRTMTAKGLVTYREQGRSFVYRALVQQEPTRQRLLSRILEGVYNGAVDRLVEGAVRLRPPSDEEIMRLRQLVAELEQASQQRKKEEE